MNPVKELEKHGQAVWLDFLARGFIAKGDLKRLIDTDGLKGVTSNPSIFEKAIGSSDEYDASIGKALKRGDRTVTELFETVAVEDIRSAADVLRPVYDSLKGHDGYVSLEVSPYLAMDTAATVAEARRLWKDVDRKNLMVKVPATPEGLPAIRQLTSEGLSINITLLFSKAVYLEVAEAYLAGLEKYVADGGDPSHVASVASFFVSRIDTMVDKQLDEKIARANDPSEKERLAALKGKVAIANAKLAYQDYKRLFSGPRWEKLAAKGAKPQRMLWASTGTKNKEYSDVLYVEGLIGPNTINTMPPATLEAFRDHGKLRDTLEENVDEAKAVLEELERSGISLDAITEELVKDGVKQFADAADKLYGAVAHKRATVLGPALDRQHLSLGDGLGKAVTKSAEEWRACAKIRRLWQRDKSVWTGADEDKWLGWLDSAAKADVADYADYANRVKGQKFSDAVVLGMGGSSLGPEVLAETFARKSGFPKLHVLDSTDPAQVRAMEASIDIANTVFIVSSKSGGTTEPNAMKDYFHERVAQAVGSSVKTGHRFIAVTDPGSSLEKAAKQLGYARIFHGEPSIGGRYSVLSPFGLVPAATAGIDVKTLIKHALSMVRSCGPDVPPQENPGVQLGLAMGLAGLEGRDKVTILSSKKIADFGAWAEQLIAESTGKEGKGLIPIDGEPLGNPSTYGNDRFFIDIRTEGEADADHDAKLTALEQAGHPVVRIVMKSIDHLGQEFFRFEMATAVAGAILGINPFDQPDVEAAKIKTRELTAAFEKTGALPAEEPVVSTDEADLYTDEANAAALRAAGANGDLTSWLKAHLSRSNHGDYVALLGYIARDNATIDALQAMRLEVREKRHVATCAEFGPRFLHSTGQAYKGGPDSGVFLQITADDAKDLAVPGQKASFGVIKAAQARGDFDVLTERGRRALRVHLKGGLKKGLAALNAALSDALN
ncbi:MULTISPECIES: bifunctional transaldolase/phosoglucose isomerase [unclassified Bradyrhizobium]|uniref:bifunctional transaldolase/phosoglucose isomerase n=1 Tax=unclassified Bradyrhizobium TaxID=2631580 RepID=UPI00247ADB4D|nr:MULTISPECIES: bifunctional transaldolase/phosoglucose isomerase [unclassified Bradyrhizobium]WGR69980.1 bifunctional transaldolase/phosoglucose isomerase [Bradyrhizobium sp. ISRA426]WGR82037.1 bifunctional transaldolase/phosoglucose isomerase [Bradyrhizobium sp. ISRA430]WGR85223.1 bifunctional transaldolase/phosoglucose isomerase [Bradyrhizobium sp. ISRA432]